VPDTTFHFDSRLYTGPAKAANPRYGETPITRIDIAPKPVMPPGFGGWVTFNPANRQSDAYSTNNLERSRNQGWDRRSVPKGKCHLVAVGRCGAITKRIEVMLHIPKYPWPIASDGEVEVSNSLVAPLASPEDAT